MKALLILAAGCCLLSCRTTRTALERNERRDSIYTERVEQMEKEYSNTNVVVKDTLVTTLLPAQESKTVGCDSSVLETNYAVSSAWIDAAGKLNHLLRNKDSAQINVVGGKTEITKENTSDKVVHTVVEEHVKEDLTSIKEDVVLKHRFMEWFFYPFGVICFCLLVTWGVLKLISKQLFK